MGCSGSKITSTSCPISGPTTLSIIRLPNINTRSSRSKVLIASNTGDSKGTNRMLKSRLRVIHSFQSPVSSNRRRAVLHREEIDVRNPSYNSSLDSLNSSNNKSVKSGVSKDYSQTERTILCEDSKSKGSKNDDMISYRGSRSSGPLETHESLTSLESG